MPLVTVTLRKTKTTAFKKTVLDAIQKSLVASGVPEIDYFQRILELSEDDFYFHPTYPDLTSPRNDQFVLIEILLSVGRSVKIKKKIVADIMNELSASKLALSPENIMVCFKETGWENWSFGGGRFLHA